MRISNWDELISFIEDRELTISEMNSIVQSSIGVLIVMSETKEEVIAALKAFRKEYGRKPRGERPVFLDLDIDLDIL